MRERFLLSASLVLGLLACSPVNTPGENVGGSGGRSAPAPAGTGGNAAGGGGPAAGTGGAPGGSGGAPGGMSGTGGVPAGTGGTPADASPAEETSPPADATAGGDLPPASGALCAGAKKCFDFEDQMPGQQPSSPEFKVELARGTVTTDTTKSFSGKQSILIKTPGGTNFPGNNLVFDNLEKLLPANDLHGRVMMWMDKTPGRAHWDSIIGSAAGGRNPTYILGGMYMNFMSVYHPGDLSVDSNTPFPTGTWACVQWQFSGKDGKNLHKMMLNGAVVDKGITERWRAPTFSQLKVGYRHFNTNVAVDVWIDDLAFGDAPIACPPPKM